MATEAALHSRGASKLLNTIIARLTAPLHSWWRSRLPPPVSSIQLHRRNIYILPSAQGLLFLGVAALVFVASINFSISLGFALAFLMVSIFIVSLLHGFKNLQGLTVTAKSCEPVFAGDEALFRVSLRAHPDHGHESLQLSYCIADVRPTHSELRAGGQQLALLRLKARRRGILDAPRLRVESLFPLGLCRSWTTFVLEQRCTVYPRPVPSELDRRLAGPEAEEAVYRQAGVGDFAGLRRYQPGDSTRQIAWRQYARGRGLMVRQFDEGMGKRIYLDWDLFYGFGTEERLSRLCFCVLSLSAANSEFGLRMPGLDIPPQSGERHRQRILEALAQYHPRHEEASPATLQAGRP